MRTFVTPSAPVAERLIGAGANVDDVHVIEEGSDHLPEPDDEGARSLLGALGVHGPYLLAVGTLEPRKNLPRLIEAYRRARPELAEPWPLLVVGPAGWGPSLPERPEGVLLTGRVSGPVLAALYRAARLCCYVPLEEGFGLPVVEAMHAGCPVVSSPVPAAGHASVLVDPLDVDSIAGGVLDLAGDGPSRDRALAAGTARAESLTWRRCAASHAALWQHVIAGGR